MEEKKKVPERLYWTYALGNGFNTIAFTVPTLYLTMFMTDYLGITPAAIAAGMGIAKTFDFIISIFAGIIIEKVHMKHGKYVSWIRLLTGTLFFGNIVQMLDTTAFVGNANVRLFIVCAFYLMFHGSMNFNATARAAILPKICGADMEARKKFTARQAQVGAAVSIISSAITLPCIQFVEKLTGSPSLGYVIVAGAFSACFVILNVLFIKDAQPYDPPTEAAGPAKNSPTVGQMISSVVTNKQMLILFLGFTTFTVGTQIYAGLTSYYFKVTGHFSAMTIALTSRSIVGFVASLFVPSLGRKIGKKGAIIAGWGVYAVGLVILYLFGYRNDDANIPAAIVGLCLIQAAQYLYQSFMANFYLDCGEYGYATTGVDNRTMAVTVMNWPTKIGFAVGGTLVGIVLGWAGYQAPVGGVGVGTFASMSKFMTAWTIIPAITCVIGLVVILLFYKLTDSEAARYAAENAKRDTEARAKA